MIVYVIKKNKTYWQGSLNVGLRTHNNATVNLLEAKWLDDLDYARRECKRLNEENAIPYVRGRWKIITYEINEV